MVREGKLLWQNKVLALEKKIKTHNIGKAQIDLDLVYKQLVSSPFYEEIKLNKPLCEIRISKVLGLQRNERL